MGNDSSRPSKHLHNRCLPRPNASSPLDNRTRPMANTSQAPDLEGLHREIHGMAEQMRVMNENNARLIQLLAAANLPPPAAPPIPKLSDPIALVAWETIIPRTTTVRAEREEGDISRQVLPNVKEARLHRNPAKLQERRSMRLGEEDPLAEMIKPDDGIYPSDKVVIMAMIEGLRPGSLFDSLFKNIFETLSVVQSKADKYITAEELAKAKCREEMRSKRSDQDSKRTNERRPRTPPRCPKLVLPPLNAPIAQVLIEIKHEKFVKWPRKIKTDPQKRNRNKYCEFLQDHGHNTEDCFQLKEQIADLIKKGYLRKYVADCPPPNSPKRRYGGCSTSSRKKHVRNANGRADEEVYNLSSSAVDILPPITFNNDDLRGLHFPHDDALVVSAFIANFNVQRILVDNRSSADILFISAFDKMKIGLDKLHPFHTPLDFIMVDCPSPYNAILGRLTLGRTRAITSTYHLKMKFPTSTRIGEIVDAEIGALRDEIEETLLDPRESKNTKPLEEITPVSIHPDFLDRHKEVRPERLNIIEKEMAKLIKTSVIRESHYPNWLANVVVAPKKGKKWRVCVDFTDLNKACPKDSFSLPKIDLIVDLTSKHELLSFMDTFSGYYQIKMHLPDVEKTSFITERGLYCYKVMPFGLKNTGATYQRLVNKMFKEQIKKTMEVYIDDMLVKSLKVANHITHLEEAFGILRKYKMMLNPSKCIFRVSSGKFLRFLVTKRGIEVNPDQIQALLVMSSPKNIHEMQQLTGRVATLNRFVFKLADKCEELFVYLPVSSTAVSVVLVREKDRVQKLVYYVSKVLMGAETRYLKIEKLAYALLITARKLHHYFQAHPIAILNDQPLKQILQRPDTSGRFLKWFKTTNNEAEYEDLLTGLRMAIELGVDFLDIFSDSQLVVNQVQGVYLAKDTRMVAYLDEVKTISGKIRDFKIRQIPREENKKADALANLASTFDFILDRCKPLEFLASPSIKVPT
ncbi:hypothetical protein Acr_13g0006090 [Actinidia rufa]|uniref:Reverse transcriptase domain-containing protein n=1 Tax=Actinidia rufa TaxID=165716 RepID=A0A7J0FKI0_9ERIC|nr:hypothetical protein Acr_13g0006090 [Actinidia rufa]